MAGKQRASYKIFTPPAPKQKAKRAGGVKKSSEARKVAPKIFVRQVELPDETIWSGTAERMPEGYTVGHLWPCPSCDVAPGQKHEVWCPRYIFIDNPYNTGAYNDSYFLSRAGFDRQIFFGELHPKMTAAEKEEAVLFWKVLGVKVEIE